MSTDLATQEDVLEQVDGGELDPSGAEEPFLSVNDRTSYKTRDEAIKGFGEAQKTITSLSEYSKVAKEFGIKDPATIRTLFQELLQHRQEKAKAATQTSSKATTSDDDEEAQSPELKAAIKFLQKNGEKAGFVSQAKYAELQERLNKFDSSSKQSEEARAQSLVTEGQDALSTLITTGKVTLADDQRAEMEDNIKAWVNGSEARIQQWWGTSAQRAALIKTGFERECKAMGIAPAAAAVSAQGKNKAQLISRTAKPMPRDGSPAKGGKAVISEADKKKGLHARAWAEVMAATGRAEE